MIVELFALRVSERGQTLSLGGSRCFDRANRSGFVKAMSVSPRNRNLDKVTPSHRGQFFSCGSGVLSSSSEQNSILPATWNAILSNSPRIQPKTSTLFGDIVGQLASIGDHIVIHDVRVTIQAPHR